MSKDNVMFSITLWLCYDVGMNAYKFILSGLVLLVLFSDPAFASYEKSAIKQAVSEFQDFAIDALMLSEQHAKKRTTNRYKIRNYNSSIKNKSYSLKHICGQERVTYRGNKAVLFYNRLYRLCHPYFLQKYKGVWKVDHKALSEGVYFTKRGQWALDKRYLQDYTFSFDE